MSMDPVLHSFRYALDFLREQVDGVSDADLVALPAGLSNHPAWVIGHLTYSCELLGGVIGVKPWLPAGYSKPFGQGSVPVADVKVYGPRDAALMRLAEGEARITAAVGALPDARLDVVFPNPANREVFPSVRHALTQVLVGHTAHHVGQVGVWRKAMRLPPMKRGFE